MAKMQKRAIRLEGALSRDAIAAAYFADEDALLNKLIARARFNSEEALEINNIARRLTIAAREGRRRFGGVDVLLHEYNVSTREGVLLMCLAEALLRIPDEATIDALIADKIGSGKWQEHLGQSDSLLVNASTWALLLTGRLVSESERRATAENPLTWLKDWAQLSSDAVVRQAVRHAMQILGKQFVLGRNIDEALAEAAKVESSLQRFSFDMLGEAAMTAEDAERYFQRYLHAVERIRVTSDPDLLAGDLMNRPGLSVKLSSLHPRFEPQQRERVFDELLPRLQRLAKKVQHAGLLLTIDAEELDRLDMTLELFARIFVDPACDEFEGFGIAVQAYSRRALPVLQWLLALAKERRRKIPVRLVKGAYWDSEIKWAQTAGYEDYPVFTRKSGTDVSYLAAARFLIANRQHFLLQFATHNAHTIAAIQTLSGNSSGLEFQRLHGMGEAIYEEVARHGGSWPVRVYAPVGGHEELLAYLVRRLLENGANSSFINRLADDEAPIELIVRDPVERLANASTRRHPHIPLPKDLFGPERKNSSGLLLSETAIREPVVADIRKEWKLQFDVAPIVGGELAEGGNPLDNRSPQDNAVLAGTLKNATSDEVDRAISLAEQAQKDWDERGGIERARILENAAELFERGRPQLMAVMIREAGKTLENALGDVREAVDFLRYYACQARRKFAAPERLAGVTGERNDYILQGRGVFACISPWNFPLAIFTGQIAGALAAGNTVVAKPAEQTPATAFLATRFLLEAGVPGNVLHLLPGNGRRVGAQIVGDHRISGVAFTGSVETADTINRVLAERPGPIIPFIAETGGINAMIVDSSALPEQVVRDVIRSAFDSAGQRCSALRVLYLQDDIFSRVTHLLEGAMRELRIGDPLDYATDVGPVIDLEAQQSLNAYKERMKRTNEAIIDLPLPEVCKDGTFVSPAAFEVGGIEDLEGEVFGPILHIARYRTDQLERVCDNINASGYGLTLGIHSRIEQRIDFIVNKVSVGNIYVNRNQIGAVVGSQPFGGERLSGTGPKAGGPQYLNRFSVERVITTDTTVSGGNAPLISLAVSENE